jgi:hypothetical protein
MDEEDTSVRSELLSADYLLFASATLLHFEQLIIDHPFSDHASL